MITDEHVFEEMKRRINLTISIDSLIAIHICNSDKEDAKRGDTQDFIVGELGITKNKELCQLINERMTVAGFKSCTINGYQVYRHAKLLVLR